METLAIILQEGGGAAALLFQLAPFFLIFIVFYFLVIAPQRRRAQEMQNMIAELKINDTVVTNGGVIGKIKEIKDKSFIIQSADKSFIEIARSAVVGKEVGP
ncbi:MAG TPA: preprotein translocase subunit YajC [Pyrinomonadaceae bacterium]|jgi:preprotein translocase subunit YajC